MWKFCSDKNLRNQGSKSWTHILWIDQKILELANAIVNGLFKQCDPRISNPNGPLLMEILVWRLEEKGSTQVQSSKLDGTIVEPTGQYGTAPKFFVENRLRRKPVWSKTLFAKVNFQQIFFYQDDSTCWVFDEKIFHRENFWRKISVPTELWIFNCIQSYCKSVNMGSFCKWMKNVMG